MDAAPASRFFVLDDAEESSAYAEPADPDLPDELLYHGSTGAHRAEFILRGTRSKRSVPDLLHAGFAGLFLVSSKFVNVLATEGSRGGRPMRLA